MNLKTYLTLPSAALAAVAKDLVDDLAACTAVREVALNNLGNTIVIVLKQLWLFDG